MAGTIVFSHGLGGSPWGVKDIVLSAIAEEHGYDIEAVDYRDLDLIGMVKLLVKTCQGVDGPVILAGTSLGAQVSALASVAIEPEAMFLMAPAFSIFGGPAPYNCPVTVVHAWSDEVIPVESAVRWAKDYQATLHLIKGAHNEVSIRQVCNYFGLFLLECD